LNLWRVWLQEKIFLSQFELYLEEIKVQRSNYNLSKSLITKLWNHKDQIKMAIWIGETETFHELFIVFSTICFCLLGQAVPARPKRKILKKYIFRKFVISPCIFFSHFDQYWFVFLYYKDTNPVLKYLIFVKTLKKIKKYFVLMHTTKSLNNNKKKLYFRTTKKISKIYINMHFSFNNQFIKVMRTRLIFQKF
jgi:hypothetical protein